MQTSNIFGVLFAVLLLSWTTPRETSKDINVAEKNLSALLQDYDQVKKVVGVPMKKLGKLKLLARKSGKLKVTNKAIIVYKTKSHGLRKVFMIERNGELYFKVKAKLFSEAVTQNQEGGDDCEIIVDSCGGDTCSCFCVVSNSCDPSGESDPDCCNDCECEEDEDSIMDSFDDFLSALTQ